MRIAECIVVEQRQHGWDGGGLRGRRGARVVESARGLWGGVARLARMRRWRRAMMLVFMDGDGSDM